MKNIQQLIVYIYLENREIEVGELVVDNKNIYFRYYTDFISMGLQISPFKLPLSSDIFLPDTTIFDGLYGVFADSLPDGWGRLLLDRALIGRGIALHEIKPLDRLAFVGLQGRGALGYQPAIASALDLEKQLELDSIAKETQKVLEGTGSEVIEELFQLGGSSGGARPKILVGYHPEKQQLIHGYKSLPTGYEHWLIKFPSLNDLPDIAQIEYAYYKMALDAGLTMSHCQLFEGASGKLYFGTKRFDRIGNQRIHLHSAAGLMHDNFRLSSMDYGHLMDAAFRLEHHVAAYEKILRLAAFNIFSHNRDDHSKNVSFLMNNQGEWHLAPVYDLTFSMSSHGFHSTTVAGEGKNPTKQHLLELANIFNIKNAKNVINQIETVVKNWMFYAKESGVSNASKQLINRAINP